jgi:Flp pilus assembly CpaF family ATPase
MSVASSATSSSPTPSRRPPGDAGLKQRVHRRLVAAGGLDALDHVDEHDGRGRALAVRTRLAELLHDEAPLLTPARFEYLLGELTDEVSGLGPLEPLLADPEVSEVMLNGPGRAYVERAGRLEAVELDLDAGGIVRLVERVVAPLGLRLDRASPMVDARLADGSRLHALIPPLALDGPCVTIRRFRARPVDLESFGAAGAPGAFLRWTVAAGWNLLISGGTSAGKTTLLNSLSAAIPAGERVVTIEETAELRLAQPHVVRLEARPPNAEGAGAVSVRVLVRTALRMRPDRIVVGEVRGGEPPRRRGTQPGARPLVDVKRVVFGRNWGGHRSLIHLITAALKGCAVVTSGQSERRPACSFASPGPSWVSGQGATIWVTVVSSERSPRSMQDVAHRFPRSAQQRRDGGDSRCAISRCLCSDQSVEVTALREPRDDIFEVTAMTSTGSSPRDFLAAHPATGPTVDPSNGRRPERAMTALDADAEDLRHMVHATGEPAVPSRWRATTEVSMNRRLICLTSSASCLIVGIATRATTSTALTSIHALTA